MAPVKRLDAEHASTATLAHAGDDTDQFDVGDFEAELRRLSVANQELLHEFQHGDASSVGDAEQSRCEIASLRARVHELEAGESSQGEASWLERQREYEMLLEEKSEVIRALHQKIQDAAESVDLGSGPPPSAGASASRLGQAEEILRLKRELEAQRRQLEQDEEEMMTQMRQMEMQMARERAEMARQRQEVQRLKADLEREIEQSSRDPELRERLNTLRRQSDPKPVAATESTPLPQQKSSGFFRRMFG
jgi:hypothetical protein